MTTLLDRLLPARDTFGPEPDAERQRKLIEQVGRGRAGMILTKLPKRVRNPGDAFESATWTDKDLSE